MALAVIGTGIAAGGSPAWAQMGQVAMAPTGGGVNRAVQGFQGLNENGPGILYYGINAADRGLGYQGSYMTLGGFVPGFEDDLGGFWAADLRGHRPAALERARRDRDLHALATQAERHRPSRACPSTWMS